jgi:hypothetical protein
LCPIVSDRFAAIHEEITNWQKQDTNLADREGFIRYLVTCDIGQFNVGNTDRWMQCYREAKKQGLTVSELLFESRKRMSRMNLTYEPDRSGEIKQRVFLVDEEKRHELEEIDERLKTYDPARVKRKEHESR